MATEYFMHCIFDVKTADIENSISIYIKDTGYRIRVSKTFGLKVYEKSGWKFTWLYDPIDSIIVDEDIESEITLMTIVENEKELTEVRICFTDLNFLDKYFEPLADMLWLTYPKYPGELRLERLADKPIYFSRVGYFKAKAIKQREAHESFIRAFPPERKRTSGGKSTFSDEQQLAAVREWDDGFPEKETMHLVDFLEKKFGVSSPGFPYVAESTFHGWRSKFIKNGKYHPNNNPT